MGVFLGKTIKMLLWLSLFVLLGAFLFGLLKFKGNIVWYVDYLNSISIQTLFSSQPTEETPSIETELSDEEILQQALLEADLSGNNDFSSSSETDSTTMNDSSFGFSGSLDSGKTSTGKQEQVPSVSKEDLVNLIKSHEK